MFLQFRSTKPKLSVSRLLITVLLVIVSALGGEMMRPFGLFPLEVVAVSVPVFVQDEQDTCTPTIDPLAEPVLVAAKKL